MIFMLRYLLTLLSESTLLRTTGAVMDGQRYAIGTRAQMTPEYREIVVTNLA